MTYLIWQLNRTRAIATIVVIVAVGALLVPTGLAIANSYHHAVTNCSVHHVGCGDIDSIVFGKNGTFTSLVQDFAMAFPLLIGVLWGAPLLASEFEARTEDFAWTQGVTRRRWVLTNLAWAFLAAAIWGGALASLLTWWRGPDNAIDGPVQFIYFDIQGVAPIAYSVFAMAVGIAAGALFRRVVPAITTTLFVFAAVRIPTALYFRPLFAVTKNLSPAASEPTLSWSLGQDILGGGAGAAACPSGPMATSCLAAHGAYNHVTYLPASSFWPVQGVESGVFLALALALAIFTYRSVATREG